MYGVARSCLYLDPEPDSVKCNTPQHYENHMCVGTVVLSSTYSHSKTEERTKCSSKENSLYGFQRSSSLLESARGYFRDFFMSWPLDPKMVPHTDCRLEILWLCLFVFRSHWNGLNKNVNKNWNSTKLFSDLYSRLVFRHSSYTTCVFLWVFLDPLRFLCLSFDK